MAGLFGGQRAAQSNRSGLMERISMMGVTLQGGDTVQAQMKARQQEMLVQQALRDRTAQEDRLRAALSPADGPMGSGTGAAPNIQQQMAALDEARLLNPEVADAFAPVVQAREREQNAGSLFGDDPKAAMLYRTGNQAFLDSLGEQYKPQVIGAGGRQSVYGEGRTVDAPSFMQFGNQVQRNDPGTGLSVTVANRAPDPVNVAPGGLLLNPITGAPIGRGAARVFSAGDGVMLFDEDGQPIAENQKAPGASNVTEGQAKDGFNAGRLERSGTILKGLEDQGFDYGLGAVTGGQLRGDFRSYEAAALEWTDAMLRMTSGAQAPEGEVRAQMKTYFPQPGDNPSVRAQKAQMRLSAEAAARTRAGAGYAGSAPAQQPQGQRRVSSRAEYDALPSGSTFIAPDGSTRRKP